MRRSFASQEGASLVEFAIVLPLLLLLLFGAIEFGLVLYNQQVITNASREGARAGIVAQVPRVTAGQINTVVQNYCAGHLVTFAGGGNLAVGSTANPTALFGQDLNVTVSYNYNFLVLPNIIGAFFGGGLGNTLVLNAATVMRYE